MAKINYRARMREIDRLAGTLVNAVNALRQDIANEGDDAVVVVSSDGVSGRDADFWLSIYAEVMTTY